jgi:hypothetical protein
MTALSSAPDRRSARRTRNRSRARLGLVMCTILPTAAATLAVSGAAATGTGTESSRGHRGPSAEVLLEWNLIAQGQTIPLRPTAHGQLRGMAMVQGAVYDAVNAIDRGHEAYLLDPQDVDANRRASYDAAIATAAHHVLVALVPTTQHDALDDAWAATLAGVRDGWREDQGVAAGAAAAGAMLADRADDGYLAPFTFVIGDRPGDWRPAPPTALDPDAWVADLDPFLIDDAARFGSKGPNPLRSRAYARDFNEVKRVGSLHSTTRTADQTRAAIFWQAPPIALWNGVLRDLARTERLNAVDGARLLASTNLAAADGAVACWHDKYEWNFWRPMAAIREADTDGNRRTVADPAWTPLFDASTTTTPPLANPPFPDHPSGHGCVSGALLHTARLFFGTDRMEFDVHSGRFPDQPRHFRSFSGALEEIIDARVWGGIHFRTADVQGARIGKQVARWTDRHYFAPVEPRRGW